MYNKNHNRFAISLIAGCAAALMSPAVAGATEVPTVGANMHVGQLGTSVESEQVRSEADTQVDETTATAQRSLAYAQAKLRETQSRLQRIRHRLATELSARKAQVDREVAIRRAEALQTASRLNGRVKRLRIQVMRASITLARSTADGAWIVVSRSGNVLNQSGGASVTRNGRSSYTVQFNTTRSGCANVAGSNPTSGTSGGVRVSSLGDGAFSVRITESSGRRTGGFFLALSC